MEEGNDDVDVCWHEMREEQKGFAHTNHSSKTFMVKRIESFIFISVR